MSYNEEHFTALTRFSKDEEFKELVMKYLKTNSKNEILNILTEIATKHYESLENNLDLINSIHYNMKINDVFLKDFMKKYKLISKLNEHNKLWYKNSNAKYMINRTFFDNDIYTKLFNLIYNDDILYFVEYLISESHFKKYFKDLENLLMDDPEDYKKSLLKYTVNVTLSKIERLVGVTKYNQKFNNYFGIWIKYDLMSIPAIFKYTIKDHMSMRYFDLADFYYLFSNDKKSIKKFISILIQKFNLAQVKGSMKSEDKKWPVSNSAGTSVSGKCRGKTWQVFINESDISDSNSDNELDECHHNYGYESDSDIEFDCKCLHKRNFEDLIDQSFLENTNSLSCSELLTRFAEILTEARQAFGKDDEYYLVDVNDNAGKAAQKLRRKYFEKIKVQIDNSTLEKKFKRIIYSNNDTLIAEMIVTVLKEPLPKFAPEDYFLLSFLRHQKNDLNQIDRLKEFLTNINKAEIIKVTRKRISASDSDSEEEM